ncbi:MAG TPA: DNA/RNA non-specific endonuclease, partial [Actinomycetes bacterium]
SPEELQKVTVPPEEPVPATVRTPGTGEPPVEIVPDSISPEELQKVTVPQEALAPGVAAEGTSAPPADVASVELDRSAPQPGAAHEPHPRDLPAAGDPPGLDERQQPFRQQTVPRERGGPSAPENLTGTDRRTGMAFHERNAAEIVNNLRVEYDPSAGRPVRLSYDVDRNALAQPSSSARGFARDWSTEGAQGTNAAYARSGYDRGHLVQREAFKGSVDTERAADMHPQVVPMTPELNRGAGSPWRAAERETVDLAREYGSVRVEVEPVYANDPARLRDGTPIPDTINRRVYAPDGTLLRDESFENRGAAARQPAAQEQARVRVDPSVSDGADQARIRVDQAASEPAVDAEPLDEVTMRAGQRHYSG